jgi:hypothetical protein
VLTVAANSTGMIKASLMTLGTPGLHAVRRVLLQAMLNPQDARPGRPMELFVAHRWVNTIIFINITFLLNSIYYYIYFNLLNLCFSVYYTIIYHNTYTTRMALLVHRMSLNVCSSECT